MLSPGSVIKFFSSFFFSSWPSSLSPVHKAGAPALDVSLSYNKYSVRGSFHCKITCILKSEKKGVNMSVTHNRAPFLGVTLSL